MAAERVDRELMLRNFNARLKRSFSVELKKRDRERCVL
jgi:hypothetical protein